MGAPSFEDFADKFSPGDCNYAPPVKGIATAAASFLGGPVKGVATAAAGVCGEPVKSIATAAEGVCGGYSCGAVGNFVVTDSDEDNDSDDKDDKQKEEEEEEEPKKEITTSTSDLITDVSEKLSKLEEEFKTQIASV